LSEFDSRLALLGWDPYFEQKFIEVAAPGDVPARVIADFAAEYAVHDGAVARRAAARRVDPAVGDWVTVNGNFIDGVVERRTVFSRKSAGVETREQVLASNVDVAFVVAAATGINVRRIERYLVIAWQSGAVPVVVLTKSDIAADPGAMRVELESVTAGAPVVVTSAVTGEGMEEMTSRLQPALTGVLLGPSGAGKSTLINAILGTEVMRTREIHRSGEGRHMTSHRQLIQLPGGGMIIDTPGLREAQLWEGEDALGDVFEDIEALTLRCRFSDCSHDTEPGCAIKAALADGSLEHARLRSYRKLKRELRAVAAKSDARLRSEDRKKWKLISKANRSRVRP
jgi:ribosome biogenesis GTPase / thiamine phosphate phosphatase